MAQVGWIVDLKKCIGCRSCSVACKAENRTPVRTDWRYVVDREHGVYPDPRREFISLTCNHCDDPACIKSCPATAITKRPDDGIVLIDTDQCIGCRNCYFVCPYGAPRIDTATGKVTKCTMCVHRLDSGLTPACATTCLTGALQYVPDLVGETESYPTGFNAPFLTKPNVQFILLD